MPASTGTDHRDLLLKELAGELGQVLKRNGGRGVAAAVQRQDDSPVVGVFRHAVIGGVADRGQLGNLIQQRAFSTLFLSVMSTAAQP